MWNEERKKTNFSIFRKHLGGVGEPIQSYNSKSAYRHTVALPSVTGNPAEKRKLAAFDEDMIDVGKVGDENLDIESKYFV